jgi:IS30 family transposase
MSRYTQLSLEERCSIARLHEAGQSSRQIAAALDRQPSTIARELKRNSGNRVGYQPAYAQAQASARRWTGCRLERNDDLRGAVLDRLAAGWSPEQIAGRLEHEEGRKVISHETIYRFVYAQLKRTNDTKWRLYLPRAKIKRGWRTKGGWPRTNGKCSIHDRPADIATRQTPGHWEADMMGFSDRRQNLLVAQERTSRFTLVAKPLNRKAAVILAQLRRWFSRLPPGMRQSLTQDNGPEFARHHKLAKALGLKTYFCDPHSPWQKGSIENMNGRLRRTLPRSADLATISHPAIAAIAKRHNDTPRKCLGFKTPAEVFQQLLQLSHFKCESTPRLSPG